MCLKVLELASLEKKEIMIFDFVKFIFLASIKLSWNQKTYLYSGGSGFSIDIHFFDLEVSYDVLSPLPIVLSTTLIPYIEMATVISDTYVVHEIGCQL